MEVIHLHGKYVNLKKESKTEEVELPDKEIGVKDKKKKVKVISEFSMNTKDNVEYRFNSSGQLIYMAEANEISFYLIMIQIRDCCLN